MIISYLLTTASISNTLSAACCMIWGSLNSSAIIFPAHISVKVMAHHCWSSFKQTVNAVRPLPGTSNGTGLSIPRHHTTWNIEIHNVCVWFYFKEYGDCLNLKRYVNLTSLPLEMLCTSVHIVINSGWHTMGMDYLLKLTHLPFYRKINHNLICWFGRQFVNQCKIRGKIQSILILERIIFNHWNKLKWTRKVTS